MRDRNRDYNRASSVLGKIITVEDMPKRLGLHQKALTLVLSDGREIKYNAIGSNNLKTGDFAELQGLDARNPISVDQAFSLPQVRIQKAHERDPRIKVFEATAAKPARSRRTWNTAEKPPKRVWGDKELTSGFCDETKRKGFSSGQFIPANIEIFASYARSQRLADADETDEAILKRFGPEAGFGSTEEEFFRQRNSLIKQYVEGPCQPLVKHLLDQGMITTSANAYNSSPKGVYWFDPQGGDRYFTSIANGKTYIMDDHGISQEQPVDIDFYDAMPEGCNPSAHLEL